MTDYAFTFGTDHNHPILGERLSEGYVVIEAPGFDVARAMMFSLIGPAFAFQYDMSDGQWQRDNETKGFYPAGELLRIAWLGINQQTAIAIAIEDTYEKAEGGSNDDEIQALQDARDLLAAIIRYTPQEDREEGPLPSVLDKSSSASVQHFIETGRYLTVREVIEFEAIQENARRETPREPATGQSGEW